LPYRGRIIAMSQQFQSRDSYLIGILSDTHGRLPQGVTKAFKEVDLIIHAGDIGEPEILTALEKIAPTIAVRGNMDFGPWSDQLGAQETIEIKQTRLLVLHDVYHLSAIPQDVAPDVVVSGHTHRPLQEENEGILYINPGSAGYPKYGQPATVARLRITEQSRQAEIVELKL